MMLSEIAKYLDAKIIGNPNVEIRGINYDSRKVVPGDLFVCMIGEKSNGHDFIQQGIKNGALALMTMSQVEGVPDHISVIKVPDTREGMAKISNLWYGCPDQRLRMIGVTGTNGKTTTTHLIKGLLEQKELNKVKNIGLIGTVHNLIGEDVLPSTHTTPESWELSGLLHQMIQRDTELVVMEVSSHALKQNRVRGCEFDGGVFTNLTQDHLDYHLNFADYLESKLKLFQNLHLGLKSGAKYAVINEDDPMAEEFKRAAKVPVWTYGIKEKAHLQATDIKISPRGTTFNLKTDQGQTKLTTPLIGIFNVYNSLAAITVALLEGISIETIKENLANASQVAGRFELVDEGQSFPIIVDYAHTPDGLENILTTAKEITDGRLITVFGCGGDRDRGKRPLMGAISGKYSNFSIITSDNPRTEDPQAIILEIEKGISPITSSYKIIEDRRKAIAEGIRMAEPSDMVVIAGKGHEDYQILKGETIHFDDREVAREILHNMNFRK